MRTIHYHTSSIKNILTAIVLCCMFGYAINIQAQRERIRLDENWQFAFGNAASPEKDFGCGTEAFNYLTKAASVHNTGPYSSKFDASEWKHVDLPHDWIVDLPYAKDASHSHGYKTIGWKYPETSVGWYRRKFYIAAEDSGKHIAVRFDGIFRNAQVFCNGFYLGHEPSGYATQVYDLTEYLNYGAENLLTVRVDASTEEGWYYEGAGIYRDVWLEKMSLVHVAPFGTFVTSRITDSYKAADVNIEVRLSNKGLEPANCTVLNRVLDATGREVVSTQKSDITLAPKQEEVKLFYIPYIQMYILAKSWLIHILPILESGKLSLIHRKDLC